MTIRANVSDPDPAPSLLDAVQGNALRMTQDLDRARELLRDAMSKIASFVQVLNEGVEHAQALTRDERASEGSALESALNAMKSDARQAMLGLQVEDVLGQLIEGTRVRLDAFSSLSTELAQLVTQHPSVLPPESLHKQLQTLHDTRTAAVAQTSLDAGESELF